MGSHVRVGLVIVTFNSAAHIARCLTAVARQSHRPDRVVVIDNSSTDDTVARAREAAAASALALEVLHGGGNVGFAAANNRAVEHVHDCELIALLNPDAFPEPGWLAALVAAAAQHPEAGSFASRLVMADDQSRLDGAGDVYHVSGLAWRAGHARAVADVPEANTARPMFSACAAAALYRRSDWIAAGGFDERYFCYAEDVDLGFRLQLLDRPCWYVPDAIAAHIGGAASGRESAFAIYHGHRNLEWTFIKNMPGRLLPRYLAAHVVASCAALGWFFVRGAGAAIVRAKWDALRGLPAMWRERQRVQASRKVSEDALRQRLDRSSLLGRLRDRRRRR